MFDRITIFVRSAWELTWGLIGGVLYLFNFSAGIVGAIWLFFIGGWKMVIAGIVLSMVMPWGYTIINLPNLGLLMLVGYCDQRHWKVLGGFVAFLMSMYQYTITAIWCLWIFQLFITPDPYSSAIPYLLWGYSTVMSPLSYMASSESDDNVGTALGLLFAQVCYAILVLYWYQGGTVTTWLIVVGIIAAIFSIGAVALGIAIMIEEEKREKLWSDPTPTTADDALNPNSESWE